MAHHTVVGPNELSINISLACYEHGEEVERERSQTTKLRARNTQRPMGGWTLQSQLKKSKTPPISPSLQELGTEGVEVVWVGMYPRSAPHWTQAEMKTRGVNTKKGASVNDNSSIRLKYDPDALRVVSPVQGSTACYYVLVDSDNGLCHGYYVSIHEVFFFDTFRDNALTSHSARLSEWPKKVRDLAIATQPKERFPVKYDKARYDIPKPRSQANEVVSLISTYLITGDTDVLKQAKDVLAETTDGTGEENKAIWKFMNDEGDMDNDTCHQLVLEFETLWPPLNSLRMTAEELSKVHAGLRQAGICLDYHLLRAFVVNAILAFRRSPDMEPSTVAEESRDIAALQIGAPKGTPPFSEGALKAMFEANAEAIRSIRCYNDAQLTALKDSMGSHVIADSLPQICAKYGQVKDVDNAKLLVQSLVRFCASTPHSFLRNTNDMLKDLENHLRACASGLPDEDDEMRT